MHLILSTIQYHIHTNNDLVICYSTTEQLQREAAHHGTRGPLDARGGRAGVAEGDPRGVSFFQVVYYLIYRMERERTCNMFT